MPWRGVSGVSQATARKGVIKGEGGEGEGGEGEGGEGEGVSIIN